jgi:hypothetical protein
VQLTLLDYGVRNRDSLESRGLVVSANSYFKYDVTLNIPYTAVYTPARYRQDFLKPLQDRDAGTGIPVTV